MSQISFKRGKVEKLKDQALVDGQLSFTLDEGKIYLDYTDGEELKRRAFYDGVLTIGDIKYDGTTNVDIPVYDGEID